jgi:hypothetical protein
MSEFAQLWYWRDGSLNDRWARVESFGTDEHPKSTTIIGGDRPSTAPAFSWTTVDAAGRLVVGMTHDHLPHTPPLWWVLREEDHGIVPTVSLIAFADGRHPDGTVLSVAQARAETAPLSSQAGAIRWGKGNPKLEQVYTAPEFRRRRMAIKMIHTADILNEAAGWGGYLYGGEELTPDGQQLAAAWQHSKRLRPQTAFMPPME